ncbi:Putative protein of unknown function [Podospora comata]|uniref:Uncharacterized protein n=1 Tax=Podospora comata TaxID=48703 RepID=A0ABY6RZG5_PODCO|nr:Putative protein of unknown function [Podospora comata]
MNQDADTKQQAASSLSPSSNSIIEDENAKVDHLYQRLLQDNTVEFFGLRCQEVWNNWIVLLSHTILPPNITSHDDQAFAAFRAVQSVLSNTAGTIQRLTYLRLVYLFAQVKTMIRTERQSGMFRRKRGNSDDSVAINISERACNNFNKCVKRSKIIAQRRIARRWALLSQECPLSLLVFSSEVEIIMYLQWPMTPYSCRWKLTWRTDTTLSGSKRPL